MRQNYQSSKIRYFNSQFDLFKKIAGYMMENADSGSWIGVSF